ncbi:MAG: hypothetical protein HFF07_03760 [Oscillospiraceae bacterium]|nr:hypothetical protein [Oscillospiraceae bacterium]
MTNFLERALEQGPEREREGEMMEIPAPAQLALETAEAGRAGPRWGRRAAEKEGALEGRGSEWGEEEGMEEFLRRATLPEEPGLRSWRRREEPFEGDGKAERRGGEPEGRLGAMGRRGELALLSAVRRGEEAAGFVRGQGRNVVVTLPEAEGREGSGLDAEGLDRMAERDARRYGGGFSLY